MALHLYAHPLSSYCWKVLIPLYENGTPFEYRNLTDPAAAAEFGALSPFGKLPVMADGERTVFETTVMIEYLDVHHPGRTRFVPRDADAALETRLLDRVFDNYVQTPMQKIVADSLRGADEKDPAGVRDAHSLLESAYRWLDRRLAGREWAAGAEFGLADCAAAPALLYGHWVHAIDASLTNVLAYRRRLLARPSCARAVDEARPYRTSYPLPIPPGE
jgi:glutathione S-transferase